MSDKEMLEKLAEAYKSVNNEIEKTIIGQKDVIHQLLICLLSNGHCLLVGVPGLAKTLLISTLSKAVNLHFNRIQFTPDLMPGDITGSELLEENKSTGERVFRFVKGPVFSNIVLADEINRTPPKTQAALLQAMQEYNVTISGQTYALERPFFVLATQNPIEQEGTYPLPEAQLDRFMFFVKIGYPGEEDEKNIVLNTTGAEAPQIQSIISGEEIIGFQQLIRRIPVSDTVARAAIKAVRLTRPTEPDAPDFIKENLIWGAGPRASQYLILGAKTQAALDGRPAPSIEDIRAVAKPVLRHRLILSFNAEAEGIKTEEIIDRVVQEAL